MWYHLGCGVVAAKLQNMTISGSNFYCILVSDSCDGNIGVTAHDGATYKSIFLSIILQYRGPHKETCFSFDIHGSHKGVKRSETLQGILQHVSAILQDYATLLSERLNNCQLSFYLTLVLRLRINNSDSCSKKSDNRIITNKIHSFIHLLRNVLNCLFNLWALIVVCY